MIKWSKLAKLIVKVNWDVPLDVKANKVEICVIIRYPNEDILARLCYNRELLLKPAICEGFCFEKCNGIML